MARATHVTTFMKNTVMLLASLQDAERVMRLLIDQDLHCTEITEESRDLYSFNTDASSSDVGSACIVAGVRQFSCNPAIVEI